MAWPTTLTTTYLDSDTDSVLLARPEIKATADAVNDIISMRGVADGVASLGAGGKVPASQLPAAMSTTTGDMILAPASDRVKIQDILNLNPLSVAALTGLTAQAGDVAYCSNGDAGSACFAVYDGSDWKVVALGSTVSST